jgi:hypothetical protein
MNRITPVSILLLLASVALLASGCASPSTACPAGDRTPLGVLRSVDNGATWQALENVCMPTNGLIPAEPTGLSLGGEIILYFVDASPSAPDAPHSVYRSTSQDVVHFSAPVAVYTQAAALSDPFVLRLGGGTYFLYATTAGEGNIVATSNDGLTFTPIPDATLTAGGTPGALQLPDGRVRVFLASTVEGQQGFSSTVSSDGAHFTPEQDLRLAAPPGMLLADPRPIHGTGGNLLMLYEAYPTDLADQPDPWTYTGMRFATSLDGYHWNAKDTFAGYGGPACIVPTAEGMLYIYYGYH